MIMRKKWFVILLFFAISVSIPENISGIDITGLFTSITFNVVEFFKAVLKQILLAIVEVL